VRSTPSYQRPSQSYQRPSQSYQRPSASSKPSYERPSTRPSPSPSYERPAPSWSQQPKAPETSRPSSTWQRPSTPPATQRPTPNNGWVHSDQNGWSKAPSTSSRPWGDSVSGRVPVQRPSPSGTRPTAQQQHADGNPGWARSESGWSRNDGKGGPPRGHTTRPAGNSQRPVIDHGGKPSNPEHPSPVGRAPQRPSSGPGDRHMANDRPFSGLRRGEYVPGRPAPGFQGTRPASFDHTPDRVHSDHLRPLQGGTRPYRDRDHDRDHDGRYHHRRPYYHDYHSPYHRPSYSHVRPYPYAPYGPPSYWYYRPWYTQWWVHPYWRYCYATMMVVDFPFATYAWSSWWVPPPRPGWTWMAGYYYYGTYYPGYWRPDYVAPTNYAYVPGFWSASTYVEGYYRQSSRPDWSWVDGYYLEDGTYVEGHWQPNKAGPEGYLWEPGFFDGQTYVDGFWRPEYRSGYTWVSSYYDDQGVRHNGYWLPLDDRAGQVWIPGWFDGDQWVTGYWVDQTEYKNADPSSYQAPGLDAGWQQDQPVAQAPSGTSSRMAAAPMTRSAQPSGIASAGPDTSGTAQQAAVALPVDFDRSKGASSATEQPAGAQAADLAVHLANYDFSHYPKVTLDLSVDWSQGHASGTATEWKVEVWDAGANVEPKVTYLRQVDADTDMLRVTYEAKRQDDGQRDVVVRLTRGSDTNGYGGTTFELP